MSLQTRSFPDPYQTKTIPANGKGIVYEMRVDAGMTAFISAVANNWFQDTFLVWRVDGMPVESKIAREIAPVNAPRIFDPPILAHSTVQWEAFNNSSSEVTFEVLCDGTMYKKV